MSEFVHASVLAREVVELLRPGPGKLLLDSTLGGGGHSELFLAAGARVIGLDKDPRAVAAANARLARYGEAFRAVRADFRDAKETLAALGVGPVDGALADLGVSSPQLDAAERGFSFSRPGPLDMRMGGEGAVDGADAERGERVLRVAEVGAHGAEGLAVAGEPGVRGGERARVLVEPDHARPRLEEELGVAAPAEGAVEEEPARSRAKELHHLSCKDARMDELAHDFPKRSTTWSAGMSAAICSACAARS